MITSRIKRIVMVLVLLILTSLPMLMAPNTPITYAADCSGTCKKYNQWGGGTAGGYQQIDVGFSDTQCYTGCSWVQKGMWTKNNSTGTYIFVGPEQTQTAQRYMYIVYKPSTGPVYYYINQSISSREEYAFLTIYRYGSSQRVTVASFHNGGEQNVSFGTQTTATEILWDYIHTGTRIGSISSAAGVYYYNTSYHNWLCWSCAPGGVWYTQSNDGLFLSQGDTSRMYHSWLVAPHEPGSLGGTYEAWCNAPNCP
jgi:hypothetical protein